MPRNPKFHQLLKELADLHDRKNSDYATDADPLSNFRAAAHLGVEPWRGVLVRMSDKWSRICQLVTGTTPKNESLRDSLIDLSAYSLLAILLLDDPAGTATTSSSDGKTGAATAGTTKRPGTRSNPSARRSRRKRS